jgi:D-sedoheptulose 7-phosphate isomerase
MAMDTRLESLYPFLSNQRRDGADVEAALIASIEGKAADHARILSAFFADQAQAILAAARTIAACYRQGGKLLTMGNGGSSCDSAHVAVEFLHPITAGRPSLPALDLAGDVAMLTAVGNDIGFEHIFLRQIAAHGRSGDCLLGLSTSGNSKNLIAAFRKSKDQNLRTIGLAGGNGGEMARAGLDHCLIVPTDSIHRVQETHVLIYHILWDLVHSLLADDRGSAATTAACQDGEADHEICR